MTAAPPNDSGAAASRDAARTARRLTDGTLPRRSPSAEPAPAGERASAAEPSPGPPDPRPTALTPSGPGPAPSPPDAPTTPPAGAAPVSAAPAARTDPARGTEAGPPPAAPVRAESSTGRAPTPAAVRTPGGAGAAPSPAPPTAAAPQAPTPPGVARAQAPADPGSARAVRTQADPPAAPAPAGVGPGPTATTAREAGAVSRTSTVPQGRPSPPAPTDASPSAPSAAAAPAAPARTEAPAAPARTEAQTGPGPMQGVRTPADPHATPAPAGPSPQPGVRAPAATHGAAAPAAPAAGPGSAPVRAEAPTGPGLMPARAAAAAAAAAAGRVPADPAGARTGAAPPLGATSPPAPADASPSSASRAAGAPAGPARGEAPAGPAPGVRAPAAPAPSGAGPVPAAARTGSPAGSSSPAGRGRIGEGLGAAELPGSSDLPGSSGVGVFKEERELLDFGRITGMRVASLAVPVAGVGRLPRRKNLIGAETTGSIPVHLLFRDGTGTTTGTGAAAAADDDGGPDTVAMAPPTARNAKRSAVPRPATKHARPGPARPAPTADPALVERSAAVLPGWVGIAGGLLALAGCAAVVWWAGAVPAEVARMLGLPPRPYHGIHLAQWALLALGVLVLLFAVGGLGRGRVGYAWVLTLFGEYRGTVRRTGLVWASPMLLRRRVDVRLRHWRSEPLPAVDAKGTALDVTVLVVWRVRDTVRAALGVDDHEDYLREQVEAAMARVLSQLPADAFHEDAPTLRDAEAVGEALTRMLSADCAPVGLDVFSAQPTRIEYAPEVAQAMRRRRIAAIDAKHRDSVLTSVVDAVDDVVHRLTSRGLVELDDYERKSLVKDLTVAFYTGRGGAGEGA